MAPPTQQPNGSHAPSSPPLPYEDLQLGIYAPPAVFPLSFLRPPHPSHLLADPPQPPVGGFFGDRPPDQSTNQECTPQGRQDLPYSSSSTPSNDVLPWNASLLLDPRSYAFSSDSRPQTPDSIHSSAANAMAGLESASGSVSSLTGDPAGAFFLGDGHAPVFDPGSSRSSEVTFRFMTPSAHDSSMAPGRPMSAEAVYGNGASGMGTVPKAPYPTAVDAPPVGDPDFGGMASLIEQGYNLKARSDVPEPKRRKVTPSQAFLNGGSSGILAESFKTEDGRDDVNVSPNAFAPARNSVTVDLTDSADSKKDIIRALLVHKSLT